MGSSDGEPNGLPFGRGVQPVAASHLRAEEGGKPSAAKLIVAEAVTESRRIAEEIVGFLCLADPGRRKERGEAADLRQVLASRQPIVSAVAVVTHVEWLAEGDAHQTTAGVAEAHFAVRVESSDAGQPLIGKVETDPVADDLFRVPQFFLKIHFGLLGATENLH